MKINPVVSNSIQKSSNIMKAQSFGSAPQKMSEKSSKNIDKALKALGLAAVASFAVLCSNSAIKNNKPFHNNVQPEQQNETQELLDKWNEIRNDKKLSGLMFPDKFEVFVDTRYNSNKNVQSALEGKYNAEIGQRVVDFLNPTETTPQGWCAKAVDDVTVKLGITRECDRADAYRLPEGYERNRNMEEVYGLRFDDLQDLPAGCIVTFERSREAQDGHVFVTDGNGNELSDFKRAISDMPEHYQQDMFRVFVPTGQTYYNPNTAKTTVSEVSAS